MQYEAEQFSEKVHVVKYDEFDFGLHYPDSIFIQNPYDEYNPVISVHSFFYSSNLKKYTEKSKLFLFVFQTNLGYLFIPQFLDLAIPLL